MSGGGNADSHPSRRATSRRDIGLNINARRLVGLVLGQILAWLVAGCAPNAPDASAGTAASAVAQVEEPTGAAVEEIGAKAFAMGEIVEVGASNIVIAELVAEQTERIRRTYAIGEKTELCNFNRVDELEPGRGVLLEYIANGRERIALTVVREEEIEEESGLVLPSPSRSQRLVVSPDFQQIGDTEDGGGIFRAISGTLALLADDPGMRDRLNEAGNETPAPNVEPPENVELTGIDDWISEGLLPPPAKAVQVRAFGTFRFYVWEGDDRATIVALWKGDVLQFAAAGHGMVTTGTLLSDVPRSAPWAPFPGPPAGRDLDRDGTPDLLLYDYSGGAHCCSSVKHIVCSDPPVLAAQIAAWHSDPAYEDLDGDGRYEMRVGDSAYAYWNACFAASPVPEVVFRIRKGRYEMAGDLMRKRGPTAKEARAAANEIRKRLSRFDAYVARSQRPDEPGRKVSAEEEADRDFFDPQGWRNEAILIPPCVWDLLLRLVYSGQIESAAATLDTIWPAGKPGKGDFARDLLAQIAGSWHGRRLPWFDQLDTTFNRRFPPSAEPRKTKVSI